MLQPPKILSTSQLATSDAKWIGLKSSKWLDPNGTQRTWEYAERKTRSSSGIDGVSIFAILRSRTNAFPLSTVIIEQYRPPIDRFIIEMPAGLIDENETAEQAAIRELEEETGYRADAILESSPVIVSDPGMTNANMKYVVVSVQLASQLVEPKPKLEIGEFIATQVVELDKLHETLKAYDKKGFVVDARLAHFAAGYDMARRVAVGAL